jgi:hypothetical protein
VPRLDSDAACNTFVAHLARPPAYIAGSVPRRLPPDTSLESCAKTGAGEKVWMGAVEGVFEQRLRLLRLGYASVELVDL